MAIKRKTKANLQSLIFNSVDQVIITFFPSPSGKNNWIVTVAESFSIVPFKFYKTENPI